MDHTMINQYPLFKLIIITILVAGIGIITYKTWDRPHKQKDASLLVENIYTILNNNRVPYDIDARSMNPDISTQPLPFVGSEQCKENIAHFVEKNIPFRMLLVGFPFKSANIDKKVLGYLPDMAERKSLEYLQSILNEIKKVYKPGAHILIYCDGIPFAEFFDVPFDHVVAYEDALGKLVYDLPDITLFTSRDMMKQYGLTSYSEIVQLIDSYEPSDQEFKKQMKEIPSTALKRFSLDLDYPHGEELIAQYTLEDIVFRLLARETRLRTYITKTFPATDYFRLTVHFSNDIGKKFGIKLSPNSDITPYHGVLVLEKNGEWSIRFKKDIDLNNHVLVSQVINGVDCPYYEERK